MKKLYIYAAMLMAGALSLSAQSKIDYNGQTRLLEYKMQKQLEKTGQLTVKTLSEDEKMLVLVDLQEGETVAELEEKGAVIVSQRGDLVLAEMPISQIEGFASLESVKKMSFGETLTTKLDSARIVTGFENAHNGVGLDMAYNGTGVVVGLMDAGIDPNHIAFK